MTKSCLTCSHKGVMLNAAKTLVHICRLTPPTVIGALVNAPTGPAWITTSAWPAVNDSDWCDHYLPTIQLTS